MTSYVDKLKKEIRAVKILPEDEPKGGALDNDTLIDEVPVDLRQLYVLKKRALKAHEEALRFRKFNEVIFLLAWRKEMLNGMFELALRDRFPDFTEYALDVYAGWKVFMRGEED